MRWVDVPLLMQASSAATHDDVPVSIVEAEIGADGGTNADAAGRDRQAPPAVAAAARARVAAADLVDFGAIFAEVR